MDAMSTAATRLSPAQAAVILDGINMLHKYAELVTLEAERLKNVMALIQTPEFPALRTPELGLDLKPDARADQAVSCVRRET